MYKAIITYTRDHNNCVDIKVSDDFFPVIQKIIKEGWEKLHPDHQIEIVFEELRTEEKSNLKIIKKIEKLGVFIIGNDLSSDSIEAIRNIVNKQNEIIDSLNNINGFPVCIYKHHYFANYGNFGDILHRDCLVCCSCNTIKIVRKNA